MGNAVPILYLDLLTPDHRHTLNPRRNHPIHIRRPTPQHALRETAIHACDALDGVRDRVLSAPGSCEFNPLSVVGSRIGRMVGAGGRSQGRPPFLRSTSGTDR
jgi:hypothetical protein